MRSATRLGAVATLAASAMLLGACSGDGGSGGGDGPGGGDDTPSDVALRMTIWTSNEDHLALFNSIADEYMADHPEVTSITFDPLDFESYTSTLTTQVAGGSPPDLAWVLENAAPDFVDSGALVPLEETFGAVEGYELDDLSDAATELWRDGDGQLVAYPFSTSPFVAFVNNDLLTEAGQPTGSEMQASGSWTWDEVSAAGAAVHEATGETGFVIRDFEYTTWDLLATVWNGWGAQPWSEDGATCEMTSPEMVEAFTFLHDAAFESQSMPGPGSTADFFAGEAAVTITQISRASLLPDSGIEDWEMLPLPAGPAGEYAMIGQAAIGVLGQGENPQVAADFLAYFTNPENSAALAQYFPPPRESQINAETLAATNPVLSEDQLADVVVPAMGGQVRPVSANSAEVLQQGRAALDALWVENADIPGTLEQVCTAVQPLLQGE